MDGYFEIQRDDLMKMNKEISPLAKRSVRNAVKHGATASELRDWTGFSYAELRRQIPDLPKTLKSSDSTDGLHEQQVSC